MVPVSRRCLPLSKLTALTSNIWSAGPMPDWRARSYLADQTKTIVLAGFNEMLLLRDRHRTTPSVHNLFLKVSHSRIYRRNATWVGDAIRCLDRLGWLASSTTCQLRGGGKSRELEQSSALIHISSISIRMRRQSSRRAKLPSVVRYNSSNIMR